MTAHGPVTAELVGERVRLLVEERGLTAASIAEWTGIGVRAVENRLSGLAPWGLDELDVLRHVLGLDVEEFVALFRE